MFLLLFLDADHLKIWTSHCVRLSTVKSAKFSSSFLSWLYFDPVKMTDCSLMFADFLWQTQNWLVHGENMRWFLFSNISHLIRKTSYKDGHFINWMSKRVSFVVNEANFLENVHRKNVRIIFIVLLCPTVHPLKHNLQEIKLE